MIGGPATVQLVFTSTVFSASIEDKTVLGIVPRPFSDNCAIEPLQGHIRLRLSPKNIARQIHNGDILI